MKKNQDEMVKKRDPLPPSNPMAARMKTKLTRKQTSILEQELPKMLRMSKISLRRHAAKLSIDLGATGQLVMDWVAEKSTNKVNNIHTKSVKPGKIETIKTIPAVATNVSKKPVKTELDVELDALLNDSDEEESLEQETGLNVKEGKEYSEINSTEIDSIAKLSAETESIEQESTKAESNEKESTENDYNEKESTETESIGTNSLETKATGIIMKEGIVKTKVGTPKAKKTLGNRMFLGGRMSSMTPWRIKMRNNTARSKVGLSKMPLNAHKDKPTKATETKKPSKVEVKTDDKLDETMAKHEQMMKNRRDLRLNALKAISDVKRKRHQNVEVDVEAKEALNVAKRNLKVELLKQATETNITEKVTSKKGTKIETEKSNKDLKQQSLEKEVERMKEINANEIKKFQKLSKLNTDLQRHHDQLKRSHAKCSTKPTKSKEEPRDTKRKETEVAEKKAMELAEELKKREEQVQSLKETIIEKARREKDKDKIIKKIENGQSIVMRQITMIKNNKVKSEERSQRKLDEKDLAVKAAQEETEAAKAELVILRKRLASLEDPSSPPDSLQSRLLRYFHVCFNFLFILKSLNSLNMLWSTDAVLPT